MELIYNISQAVCGYKSQDGDKKILSIENLRIRKGGIIFILGVSGIGKSTLLETLGLMNDTLLDGEIYIQGKSTKELTSDNNRISNFRQNELAFVFQQNNLLSQFTVYENSVLPGTISEDSPKHDIFKLFERFGLPNTTRKTLVSQLSGGQKQRISFIQALYSNHSILLADEPTGNLDLFHSKMLFNILKEEYSEEKGKTAIIVSHNIALALEYAKQIIVLGREKKDDLAGIKASYDRKEMGSNWNKISQNINILMKDSFDAISK